MAVDDVSFYNLQGEEISRTSLVQQMIDYYTLKLEVGETRVTDFNEGSEIRNLLEAFAVDLYMLMEEENELTSIGFIDSAEGEWLDLHGANPLIKLSRDTGSEATGFVTFTIPNVVVSDEIIIEEGTKLVSEETGLEFTTDSEGVIGVGDDSCIVPVTCLTTGSDGNVKADDLNIIDDEYISIPDLTVTNSEALSGGTDYEEDDEYRERLLSYVRQDDFGSMGYYTRLGESIDGVHDVLLVDSAVTGVTKQVLVNGDSKPVDSTILSDVLSVFSDIDNIVVGHNFTVAACGVDDVNLTLNLTMQEEIESSIIINILQTYFGGGTYDLYEFEGLYINDPVTNDKLIDILTLIEEIIDIEIIYDGDILTEITPTLNHVLNLANVTVNQTVGD